jgi:hypothetical protein
VNAGFPKLLHFEGDVLGIELDVADFHDGLPSLALDMEVTWRVGGAAARIRCERSWTACAAIDEFSVGLRGPDEPGRALALSDVEGRPLIRVTCQGQSSRWVFHGATLYEELGGAEIAYDLSNADTARIADQLDDFPRWW